ncbi:MAG: cell wall metabolism sensor histidine kinase WalK [candidate division KSB1 bacterium]|nr:cell wall metabolism sensor histidine kinase WalK [candidate division KSB1 bacterium]
MAEWIREQLRSRIFRRLFWATLAAAEMPIFAVLFLEILHPVGGRILWKVLFLPPMAAFVAGLIAFYLSRIITRPISEFEKSATKIARGDFSHEIKVFNDDEIGRLAKLFNYMTLELRRLDRMNLAKIIEERRKFETIIRNIADGVIITDPQLNITVVNETFRKWYGLKSTEPTGHPYSDVINEKKLQQLIEEATFKEKAVLPAVEFSIKPAGEWKERVLQARAARVLQDDGVLIGVVTILRDITQQKEIDRMKTELVSMVAHELRSPLTSITGFSELLLDEDLSREQAEEYARIILTEATRLSELINKFLDISRIESGRIQPKKSDIDLNDTVQMVIGNNSFLAAQKEIKVEIHEAPNLPKVRADAGMMEQVFLNLFSNAVKYSPPNTRIDIVLRSTDSSVIVEFHDQGYGIPRDALPRIFDKFFRVTENEKVREVVGTGLGLALVKQIVDLHGGHLEVESQVGKGSVFSVHLPRANVKRQTLPLDVADDIIR